MGERVSSEQLLITGKHQVQNEQRQGLDASGKRPASAYLGIG